MRNQIILFTFFKKYYFLKLNYLYKIKLMKTNIKDILKQIIKEEFDDSQVDNYYNEIIELIRKRSRELDDDSSYKLHEKLKEFFNRLF